MDFVCNSKCRKREKIRLVVFVLMCRKLSRRKFGSVSMTKNPIKMFQWKAVMIAGLQGVARRRIQRMLVARRNPTHHAHMSISLIPQISVVAEFVTTISCVSVFFPFPRLLIGSGNRRRRKTHVTNAKRSRSRWTTRPPWRKMTRSLWRKMRRRNRRSLAKLLRLDFVSYRQKNLLCGKAKDVLRGRDKKLLGADKMSNVHQCFLGISETEMVAWVRWNMWLAKTHSRVVPFWSLARKFSTTTSSKQRTFRRYGTKN